MPTRYLFEKICVSQTLAALTADEERFFYRLMVKCDDFGRYYAQPALLRAACFPLLLEQVSDATVEAWRDRLAEVGLIQVYESGGLAYLVMVTFGGYQRRRANASKFPAPPNDSARPQSADIGAPMSSYSGIRNSIFEVRDPGCDAHEPPLAAVAAASTPTAADAGHDDRVSVPAPLAGFHAVLVGTQGYVPSPAFFEQVTERYGSLDLTEQALKMRSWLADPAKNRRQRSATDHFILGWLKREISDSPNVSATPGQAPHKNGRSDSIYGPIVTVEGMKT